MITNFVLLNKAYAEHKVLMSRVEHIEQEVMFKMYLIFFILYFIDNKDMKYLLCIPLTYLMVTAFDYYLRYHLGYLSNCYTEWDFCENNLDYQHSIDKLFS